MTARLSKSAMEEARGIDRLRTRLDTSSEVIKAFCERWHVAELALFGSVLRDDFNSRSDIDVLVEFEKGSTPGLRFVTMSNELSSMLGRRVDILTRSSVEHSPNYIRRREILESAEVIYAAR